MILQHDNTTPHTANVTNGWIQRRGWEVLPHPSQSPDLKPSDYHNFGPMKRFLTGPRSADDDELVGTVRDWLQSHEGDFITSGICSLVPRRVKCIERDGDYVYKKAVIKVICVEFL